MNVKGKRKGSVKRSVMGSVAMLKLVPLNEFLHAFELLVILSDYDYEDSIPEVDAFISSITNIFP